MRMMSIACMALCLGVAAVQAQPAEGPGARQSSQQEQSEAERMRQRREARPNMGDDQSILQCPNAADSRCAEMESQGGELKRRIQEEGGQPRGSVTPRTLEAELQGYYERVVVRLGCPAIKSEPRATGAQTLGAIVSFSVFANGKLEKIEIARSSGDAKMDAAIVKQVRAAAPFEPFSPVLRTRYRVIDLVASWQLTPAGKTQAGKSREGNGQGSCIVRP